MANIYKGFSTIGKVRAPYTAIDGELIKIDLLNELKARKGERVMRPNFGTTIYDILMNPLDEFVIEGIKTTIPFHRKLMDSQAFLEGNYTTKFMEDFSMED